MHNDHAGTPVAATSDSGTDVWRESYTPFGEKRYNLTENRDDIGFGNHVQDQATGLSYMQARYYDPQIGRFLSVDPVGFFGHAQNGSMLGFNRYAYGYNDPVNRIDPNGREPITAGAVTGCAVSGPACPAGAAVGAAIGATVYVGSALVAAILVAIIADGDGDGESGQENKADNKGGAGKGGAEVAEKAREPAKLALPRVGLRRPKLPHRGQARGRSPSFVLRKRAHDSTEIFPIAVVFGRCRRISW